MLDLKRIQDNTDELMQMLASRNFQSGDISHLREAIAQVKLLKQEADKVRAERNAASKEIGALLGAGKKEAAEKRKTEVKDLGDRIAALEADAEKAETSLLDVVIGFPNYIEPEVPVGDETHNKIIREHGKKP